MSTWQTPKENWNAIDGIGYADLNRIENNINYLYDKSSVLESYIEGFELDAAGSTDSFSIFKGQCVSESGNYVMKIDTSLSKTSSTWSVGASGGALAPTLTILAHTWYYIFAIGNPTSGAVDIQIDDNPTGTNIAASGYTEKRRIGTIKTSATATNFKHMKSVGDNYFVYDSVASRSTTLTIYTFFELVEDLINPTYLRLLPEIPCMINASFDDDTSSSSTLYILDYYDGKIVELFVYQFYTAFITNYVSGDGGIRFGMNNSVTDHTVTVTVNSFVDDRGRNRQRGH
jgi:hypothetical protein